MLTPTNIMWFFLAEGIILFLAYILFGDQRNVSKDMRTAGDKAVEALGNALGYFYSGWIFWLVWNHIVVKEFSLPTISYISAFFIAFAIHAVTKHTGGPRYRND